MENRNKVKSLAKGYMQDKPNIKLSVGIIQNKKIDRFILDSKCDEQKYNSEFYEIGSITKAFTAGLYAEAIRRNQLSLSDNVIKNITVKQLLTHTSLIGELPLKQSSNPNPFLTIRNRMYLNIWRIIKIRILLDGNIPI
jgi:CubicO group peptidase (beta-lactamase class C family)